MLRLIGNTVGDPILGRAVELRATDTSNNALSSQDLVINLRGGPRHLELNLTSDGSRYVYLNKSGGLEANAFVVINADRHNTKDVKIRAWSTYSSASTDLFSSASFSESLIGPSGKDWCYLHSSLVTNQQAFSLHLDSGSYAKKLNKFYVGKSVDLSEESATYVLATFGRVSIHEPPILFYGNRFHLWATAVLQLGGITRSVYDQFRSLNLKEPLFIHDDTGTSTIGNVIENKLWHCLVLSHSLEGSGSSDDHYLTLKLGILRDWR